MLQNDVAEHGQERRRRACLEPPRSGPRRRAPRPAPVAPPPRPASRPSSTRVPGEDVLTRRECDGQVLTSRPLQPAPDHASVPLNMASRTVDERLAKIEQRLLGIAHQSCGRARRYAASGPETGPAESDHVERMIRHLGWIIPDPRRISKSCGLGYCLGIWETAARDRGRIGDFAPRSLLLSQSSRHQRS